jgi:arylsulfatase A-like enzyme
MTRRTFAAGCLASLAPFPPKRRNILLILPDQLRGQALGCLGDPNVHTPNIDRLAAEGLTFRNTFANTPVCCPARANMLTGRYAHKNGMVANDLRLRENEVTYSQLLRNASYRTGFIGKWHLDGGPRLPGFVPPGPRRHGFEFWAANECSHAHFDTHYFRDSPEPIPIHKFEAEGWTDIALEFLRQTGVDSRPFFLTVQMGPPHDPYKAPPEYSKLYDPAKLQLRPNWQPTKGGSRADIAEYYGMITAIDVQVGRILRALDDLHLADDTVVMLSSDHGDMLGSHGQRLKRKPWDESIRVPGIVRYPRKTKANGTTDVFLTHVDFAPTFLGLAGIQAPAVMQGTDLSPVIRGETSGGSDSALLQIFGPYDGDGTPGAWRGIRTGRYTYARTNDRPWLLYDNERDPYQLHDLASEPQSAVLLKEMDRRLRLLMEQADDDWSADWSVKVEDAGRLYQDKAYYAVADYLKDHP